MTRWTMVINISKCIACYACFVACKDEFWGNDYLPYSLGIKKRDQTLIKIVKRERGKFPYVKLAYMPMLCMQCDNPLCGKVAKNGAVYRRTDGVVIIDPIKAVGQREIVNACPYGLISWNDERGIPQKCTFCVHRIENGKVPRCVQACPSDALTFGDLDNPESEVSRLVKENSARIFHPEYETKPNIYYIGLNGMTGFFIAGSVAFRDTDDCAENVKVTLENKRNGEKRITYTDFFGTFEFDGLEPNTEYIIKLEHPNYAHKELKLVLNEDTYMGYIFLENERKP